MHTAAAMRKEAEALVGGRDHSLAIPSVDGFSGAGWNCLDVCADVWKAALHDNNLRNISGVRNKRPRGPFILHCDVKRASSSIERFVDLYFYGSRIMVDQTHQWSAGA